MAFDFGVQKFCGINFNSAYMFLGFMARLLKIIPQSLAHVSRARAEIQDLSSYSHKFADKIKYNIICCVMRCGSDRFCVHLALGYISLIDRLKLLAHVFFAVASLYHRLAFGCHLFAGDFVFEQANNRLCK